MAIYRPRMAALLTIPKRERANEDIAVSTALAATRGSSTDAEDVVHLTVPIRSLRLESNDHNHADEASLTLDLMAVGGLDPRLLRNAVVNVYVGNADEFGRWRPTEEDLRFAGMAKRVRRARRTDEAPTVEIDALDFTTLFLEAKPFGSSGVPDYSQRLDDAWKRIVSQTPGAEALADRIVLQGLDAFPEIGKAVSSRFRRLGKVPTRPETDAWAVWQQCVGMLGLISFIDRQRVVVTTATNLYTADRPPRLIWGRNISSLEEERDAAMTGKGIGITSFDPLTGTTLEALWPSVGDERVKRKGTARARVANEDALRASEERDYFAYYGVTDPEVLLAIAERVYEERSRQELQGVLRTAEMMVSDTEGRAFDLLSLRAGDNIRVEVEQELRTTIAAMSSPGHRVEYLVAHGYAREVAEILAANADDVGLVDPTMHVKRVGINIDVDADGGSFEVEIEYCNRIRLDT